MLHPKFTCDPAARRRELVIGLRQGLMFQVLRVIPKTTMTSRLPRCWQTWSEYGADATFVDGYGTGIVSAGRLCGAITGSYLVRRQIIRCRMPQ